MCNQKRGAMNQRREQSNSGRVGLRPQSESDSRRCERDTRERKIPRPFFSSLLFLFIPNSRCSRRVFAPWTRRESPMVYNRERQPHNQLRLRMTLLGWPIHVCLTATACFQHFCSAPFFFTIFWRPSYFFSLASFARRAVRISAQRF